MKLKIILNNLYNNEIEYRLYFSKKYVTFFIPGTNQKWLVPGIFLLNFKK